MLQTKKCIAFLSLSVVFLASCEKDFEQNKVPVADAGPFQSIELPVDSVKFAGSGTDEDGNVVAYLWSQVSGPMASTIVNPGAASTTVRGLIEGNYVFQLMATDDKGATGVDTIAVKVNPTTERSLTLQPTNNANEVLLWALGNQDYSNGGHTDIPICTWTKEGYTFSTRALLKFDLSAIPANATILSANLFLYSYPPPTINGNLTDANYGTNNSMLVQQVTANWTPSSVNWFAPPASTTANQVVVPHTNEKTLDLNLNVKPMVSAMVAGSANYGFMLKLQNEVLYTSRIFVSSYNTTHTTKYPKLVVIYK